MRARSPEQLHDEVTELLYGREDLTEETRAKILDSVKGLAEEEGGGLDAFLDQLRAEDTEFINVAMRMSEELGVHFLNILMDYADDVREEMES